MNPAALFLKEEDRRKLCLLEDKKELNAKELESPQTPLASLNAFLKAQSFKHQLSEWGTPHGSFSKLLPSLIAASLQKEVLWLSDQQDSLIYPQAWRELHFDLNQIYFLREKRVLRSLRTLIREESFSFIMIDSHHFFSKSDLHFLSQSARSQRMTLFLFRPYFLSAKKGNPFCRLRLNSSYELSSQKFHLSFIKGGERKRHFKASFGEVFSG